MSWEPTLTPSGNSQAVPLYPQLISNHNQILPSQQSSPVVCDGIWHTFISPVTRILIQFLDHSGIPCMLWLKVLSHTMGSLVRSNNFTWSKNYFLQEESSRTLKPIFFPFMTPVFTLITISWRRLYNFKCTQRKTFLCSFSIGIRQVILRTNHFTCTPNIHTEELVRPMKVR